MAMVHSIGEHRSLKWMQKKNNTREVEEVSSFMTDGIVTYAKTIESNEYICK